MSNRDNLGLYNLRDINSWDHFCLRLLFVHSKICSVLFLLCKWAKLLGRLEIVSILSLVFTKWETDILTFLHWIVFNYFNRNVTIIGLQILEYRLLNSTALVGHAYSIFCHTCKLYTYVTPNSLSNLYLKTSSKVVCAICFNIHSERFFF